MPNLDVATLRAVREHVKSIHDEEADQFLASPKESHARVMLTMTQFAGYIDRLITEAEKERANAD